MDMSGDMGGMGGMDMDMSCNMQMTWNWVCIFTYFY